MNELTIWLCLIRAEKIDIVQLRECYGLVELHHMFDKIIYDWGLFQIYVLINF